MRKVACLLVSSAALVGCANLDSINRETRLAPGWFASAKAVHLDIKQRVLISKSTTGGEEIVCAEPSPDALSAFATAASGGIAARGYGSAAGALALSEAAASVGLRTQSITLLRDALYRICEAYYNGQLDRHEVRLLLARTQDLTTAVVSIEQLTGAVVAQQAALGGGAGSASSAAMFANAEALAQARALEEKYKKELDEAKAAQTKAANDYKVAADAYNAAPDPKPLSLKQDKDEKERLAREADEAVKLKQTQVDDITKSRPQSRRNRIL